MATPQATSNESDETSSFSSQKEETSFLGGDVANKEPDSQQQPRVPENEKSLLDNVDDDTNEGDEEEEEEWSSTQTENIYSLIFAAEPYSLAFLMFLFIFGVQVATMAMALSDIINAGEDNPLNIPANVVVEVRAAQFFALTYAIPYFGDMLDAVEKFQEGYNPAIMDQARHATFWKWFLAFSLQFCVGGLYIGTTFILVIQSSTVLGMFLNFAALSFIVEIDDVAFILARKGYLTAGVQKTCDKVINLKTPDVKKYMARRIFFALAWVGLMVGLITIATRQGNGYYQCKKVLAHFGDEFIPDLPLFSGEYKMESNRTLDGRPVYTAVSSPDGRSYFRYCKSEKAWVLIADILLFGEDEDDCDFWDIKSGETKGFDITESDASQWKSRRAIDIYGGTDDDDPDDDDPDDDGIKLVFPVESFSLLCNDCDEATTCDGSCENNECRCEPGHYGLNCQYSEAICSAIGLDRRTHPFGGGTLHRVNVTVSTSFELLRTSDDEPMMVYGRPVYVNAPEDGHPGYKDGVVADVLVNMGRRYTATFFYDSTPRLYRKPRKGEDVKQSLRDYFLEGGKEFHAYFDWTARGRTTLVLLAPFYMSDPLDYGTSSDTVSPTGLSWYLTENDSVETYEPYLPEVGPPVDTVLGCTSCGSDYDCFFHGFCSNEKCHCDEGFQGRKCEINQVIINEPWCTECLDNGNGYCIPETKECECKDGYTGSSCNTTLPWCEGCNQTNGFCDGVIESCVCDPNDGYSSESNCNELADWCQGCANGWCSGYKKKCICSSGYKGAKCEEREEWCEGCDIDHSFCDVDSQTCVCDWGYEGDCSVLSEWCDGCEFGICNIVTETCECIEGYSGEKCDLTADWCVGCSLIGGECDGDLQTCACKDGFLGESCNEAEPWCLPCSLKGGECNAATESCTCSDGFTGEFCDESLPWCEPCNQDGGKCTEENKSCSCFPGYAGEFCNERDLGCELCSIVGGLCHPNTKSCLCFDGFEGENCDIVSPWCEGCPQDINKGYCDLRTESCICHPAWEGELCDIRVIDGINGTADSGSSPTSFPSAEPSVDVTNGTVDSGNTPESFPSAEPSVDVTNGTVDSGSTPTSVPSAETSVDVTNGTVDSGSTPSTYPSSEPTREG